MSFKQVHSRVRRTVTHAALLWQKRWQPGEAKVLAATASDAVTLFERSYGNSNQQSPKSTMYRECSEAVAAVLFGGGGGEHMQCNR
eukprot:5878-Heterococcus_DN1.PRE.1